MIPAMTLNPTLLEIIKDSSHPAISDSRAHLHRGLRCRAAASNAGPPSSPLQGCDGCDA